MGKQKSIGLKECENNLPATLIEKCRHYYDRHVDLLLSTDGPRIIHRDFRPGNLFIDNGTIQGIIDWSSARGGFAEEDFCPLELDEWLTDPGSIHSFLLGYASIRKVPDYRRILPLLRLSRAIATMGFTIKRGTWNSKSSKLYRFYRQHIEQLLSET